MNWQDKPDGDGLWWFQDTHGIRLYAVVVSKSAMLNVLDYDGKPNVYSPTYCPEHYVGKWQRCTITKPEPYVAPKPPKVEQYTAKHCGEFRFLSRIGDYCLATDADCKRSGTWIGWNVVQAQYTDIQPCDQANT